MEATAAAERMGVSLEMYTSLLELQHRDIMPEDYDTLQLLDSNTKPKTLNQATLEAKFPAWTVPEGGGVPAPTAPAERAPHASRSLAGDFGQAADAEPDAEPEAETEGGSSEGDAAAMAQADEEAEAAEAAEAVEAVEKDADETDAADARALGCPASSHSVWDAERTCSICLEKFLAGQLVRSLPCSHVFHAECIDSWLTQNSRHCPEDNIPVLAEEEMAELDAAEAEQQQQLEQEQEQHSAAAMSALAGGGFLESYTLALGMPQTLEDEYYQRLDEAYRHAEEMPYGGAVDSLLATAAPP